MQKIEQVRPFLRWVGGKRALLGKLLECAGAAGRIERYFEPFLGGGALFFGRTFPFAYLSDDNPWLIHAYKAVRDQPTTVYEALMGHRRCLEIGQRDYYDGVKADYNQGILAQSFDFEQAVRFIFLNRSNFNGVYRVNLKGIYNVPIGSTCRPYIPPEEIFIQASARLKHAELTHGDFEVPLKEVREGDFVYLDPPYPKLSPTANFNHYTMDPFSEQQQRKLAAIAHALKDKGVNVMISNAGVPLIDELFERGWTIHITEISRRVSAKRPPLMAKELIITSFPS